MSLYRYVASKDELLLYMPDSGDLLTGPAGRLTPDPVERLGRPACRHSGRTGVDQLGG